MDFLDSNKFLLALGLISILAVAFKIPDVFLPILLSTSMRREFHPILPRSMVNTIIFVLLCFQSIRFAILGLADTINSFGSNRGESKIPILKKLFVMGLIGLVVVAEWNRWKWDGGYPDKFLEWMQDGGMVEVKERVGGSRQWVFW